MCRNRCLLSRIWINLVWFSICRLITNIYSKLMFELYSTPRIQSLHCTVLVCIVQTMYDQDKMDIPTKYSGWMCNFDGWIKYHRFIIISTSTSTLHLNVSNRTPGSTNRFKVQVQCQGSMFRFNGSLPRFYMSAKKAHAQ